MFVCTGARSTATRGRPSSASASVRARRWSSARRASMSRHRDQPGGREHAHLAHPAAVHLAVAVRLGEQRPRPDQHAADRRARPLERHSETLSNGAQTSASGTPSATAAFQARAPSRWSGTPASRATSATARATPSGTTVPARLVVGVLQHDEARRRLVAAGADGGRARRPGRARRRARAPAAASGPPGSPSSRARTRRRGRPRGRSPRRRGACARPARSGCPSCRSARTGRPPCRSSRRRRPRGGRPSGPRRRRRRRPPPRPSRGAWPASGA